MRIKNAFTLAEILIVFAIIGITAAITIPTVIWSIKKVELTSKFSKATGVVGTAVRKAESEHGFLTQWEWKSTKYVFETYLSKHLSIIEHCAPGAEGCEAPIYAFLNGTAVETNPFNNAFYRFTTADGMKWAFGYNSDCLEAQQFCGIVRVDVNGDAMPNTYGRDLFTFYILPFTNEVAPEGMYTYTGPYDKSKGWPRIAGEEADRDCNPAYGGGTYCGAKLMKDSFEMKY